MFADGQQGIISLPNLVRLRSFAAIKQIKGRTIGFTAGVREGDQCGVEVSHHLIDTLITGCRPAVLSGNGDDLAMDEGGGRGRFAECQPFDDLPEFGL
jgi:hypothetical protein